MKQEKTAPLHILATWQLPKSRESVHLEIIRDADGLDSPRLNYTAGMKPGDNPELPREDEEYLETILEPMIDQLIGEYFRKRTRYCKLRPGAKRVSTKRGKCSLLKARRQVQADLQRLKRNRQLKAK